MIIIIINTINNSNYYFNSHNRLMVLYSQCCNIAKRICLFLGFNDYLTGITWLCKKSVTPTLSMKWPQCFEESTKGRYVGICSWDVSHHGLQPVSVHWPQGSWFTSGGGLYGILLSICPLLWQTYWPLGCFSQNNVLCFCKGQKFVNLGFSSKLLPPCTDLATLGNLF